jgi:hypothetical protein
LEQLRISGELLSVRENIVSLESQQALVEQRRALLDVVSPSDGQVVTWQVEDLLMGRPIQRGDLLLTIAEPKGEWELEVHMPENRVGHIQEMKSTLPPGEFLQVEFIVASDE